MNTLLAIGLLLIIGYTMGLAARQNRPAENNWIYSDRNST